MVQRLRLCTRSAGGPSSIPGQGIRSHMLQLRVLMPQLKIPCTTAKTWCNQINKLFFKKLPLYILMIYQWHSWTLILER